MSSAVQAKRHRTSNSETQGSFTAFRMTTIVGVQDDNNRGVEDGDGKLFVAISGSFLRGGLDFQ
jgi:hypothetical protein